jgi:hypothetical protein
MRIRLALASVAGAALALASATPAHAAAIGITGNAQIVPAPANLAKNAFESDTAVRVIDESAVTLGSNLTIWVSSGTGMTQTTYTARTCVQSHLLHFDQVGTGTNVSLTGSATFSQPLIGVLPINTPIRALDGSDGPTGTFPFGTSGTTYATPNDNARGFEPVVPVINPNGDTLSFPASNSIGFTFRGDGWDEVRVLTLCDPATVVPEAPLNVLLPLSAAATVIAGVVVVVRRRHHAAAL